MLKLGLDQSLSVGGKKAIEKKCMKGLRMKKMTDQLLENDILNMALEVGRLVGQCMCKKPGVSSNKPERVDPQPSIRKRPISSPFAHTKRATCRKTDRTWALPRFFTTMPA